MYQLAKKEKQDLAVKNLNLAKVHLHQLPYMYVKFVKAAPHILSKQSNNIVFVRRNAIFGFILNVFELKL